MKKMKGLICFGIAGLALLSATSCQTKTNQDETHYVQNDTDVRYDIYLMAKESGYSGTYEQWLESIKGAKILLQVSDGYIQMRYSDSETWIKLISLAELTGKQGEDGKTPEMRVADGFIQWKYTDEGNNSWRNLLSLSSLIGTTGQTIELSTNTEYIIWKYSNENNWKNLISLSTIRGKDGINGERGKSAYDIAVELGYSGTVETWLESLKGINGTNGKEIVLSINGGYISWKYKDDNSWIPLISLETLKGETGNAGASAFEIFKKYHPNFNGTEEDWLESLKGTTGNGIESIIKTGTSGNIDTYTITFTDGTSTTFTVTNGNNSTPSINGNVFEDVTYSCGYSGFSKNIVTYNLDERSYQIISYKYINDEWIPYAKRFTQYDEDNNYLFNGDYTWDNNEWKMTSGSKMDISTSGNVKIKEQFYWSNSKNIWEPSMRSEVTYDNNGEYLFTTYFDNWSYDLESWTTKSIERYENNHCVLSERYSWSSILNDWVGQMKYEKAWHNPDDSGSNPDMEARYTWSTDKNDWVGESKTDRLVTWHHDDDMNADITNQVLYTYSWSNGDSAWESYSKVENKGIYWDNNSSEATEATYYWSKSLSMWIGTEKTTHYVAGKTKCDASYSWSNETNDWAGEEKQYYEKDDFDRNIVVVDYRWDTTTSDWICNNKNEYEYDSRGSIISQTEYTWSLTKNDWIGNKRFEYEYSSGCDITCEAKYIWDDENGKWVGVSKWSELESIIEGGVLTTSITYKWDSDNDSWIGKSKEENELLGDYDTIRQETKITYYWSTQADDWVYSTKHEEINDNLNDNRFYANYTWSSELNCWIGYGEKNIIKHIGTLEISETYHWSVEINDWIGYSKSENEFNESGNTVCCTYYQWSSELNDWKASSMNKFYYENGIKTKEELYSWNDELNDWELTHTWN